MVATLLLAPACLVLLALLVVARPEHTPPATTATPEPVAVAAPDHAWMEAFRFPGQNRIVSGSRLLVAFNDAVYADGAMTPSGRLHLSQLAAVGAGSARPVSIRLLLNSGDAEVNQRHAAMAVDFLRAEGFANVTALPEQRDPNLGKQSTLIAEIVPVD